MTDSYAKIAQLKTPAALRARLAARRPGTAGGRPDPDRRGTFAVGCAAPAGTHCAWAIAGAFIRWKVGTRNRDGSPSELTLRRWEHFGRSGAKLVWGGEAAAVQPEGRANPHQRWPPRRIGPARTIAGTTAAGASRSGSAARTILSSACNSRTPAASRDRTGEQLEPRIAYHHPLLDAKFGIAPQDDSVVWTDAEIEQLIDNYRGEAGVAHDVGFHFVDVKACHGYLLHEFLSARVGQVRSAATGPDAHGCSRRSCNAFAPSIRDLAIGVRLSVFDTVPYQRGTACGEPLPYAAAPALRVRLRTPRRQSAGNRLAEPMQLLRELHAAGRRGRQRDVRQSVLQPAHPATGDVSAQRRLPAAGGSVGRVCTG